MLENLYYYNARLIRVVDGDTLEVSLDMGFKTWRKVTIRLSNIDCPEIRGVERSQGLKAKDFVQMTLPNEFIVKSNSVDDFGRAIADVWFQQGQEWVNLNNLLVVKELAESKNPTRIK